MRPSHPSLLQQQRRIRSRESAQHQSGLVDDNQPVTAGQLLARIDDRDYRAALASAQADVTVAEADIANFDAEIARHPALVAQAEATLRADGAAATFAQANAVRYRNLSTGGAGTTQERQQADSTLAEKLAATDHDRSALAAVRQQIGVLEAGRAKAVGARARAQAALDQAKLNLSYSEIRAPVDGIVGQRTVRVGAFVAAGTPLLAVVPLAKVYVVANFQENQLADMRLGQPSTIRVDSLPGLTLKAHVDSLAPVTGLALAPIAPDNATGNFTKVVQRLPVKLTIDPGQPEAARLHVGLSVVPTVDVTAKGGAALSRTVQR
ncbi:HlyD family secretion protein [Sphingomonas morindae]|uniref:HlyD family secretion protein n=1 Tax=Sphingomonas morindae TaxID=1541170 RepID=A0ABY4X3U9_9SPHN|nr:HlyD family secretion protein [Sphingomonas morindae]USI71560.1 HlyD family secretion protein [Sphingomonas morindae]